MLKAFSQINYKNIILKIIGSGDMEEYYKEKAKELNISEGYIFRVLYWWEDERWISKINCYNIAINW